MKKTFLFISISFVSVCFALPAFATINDKTGFTKPATDITDIVFDKAPDEPITLAGRGGRDGGGDQGDGRGRGQGGQGGGNGGGGGGGND